MGKQKTTKQAEKKSTGETSKNGVKKSEVKKAERKNENQSKDNTGNSAASIQEELDKNPVEQKEGEESKKPSDAPKKKKPQKKHKFLYVVAKKNYIRSNTTFGSKQKSQPSLKHKNQSQFYAENPVPKAPLLTKLLKYMCCQVKTLSEEKAANQKIKSILFSSEMDEKKRQKTASAVFTGISQSPELMKTLQVEERTVSKIASAVLIHAIDCLNARLFGGAVYFMNGAHILKASTFKNVFMSFRSCGDYFGPRFRATVEPILDAFEIYEELQAKKKDLTKEKYQEMKKEQQKKIDAILKNQISQNGGVDLLYQNAVSGIGQRFSIPKISQPVKVLTEIIYRCYVSEVIYRASQYLGPQCGTNNFREDQIKWAIADMGLKVVY